MCTSAEPLPTLRGRESSKCHSENYCRFSNKLWTSVTRNCFDSAEQSRRLDSAAECQCCAYSHITFNSLKGRHTKLFLNLYRCLLVLKAFNMMRNFPNKQSGSRKERQTFLRCYKSIINKHSRSYKGDHFYMVKFFWGLEKAWSVQ